MSSETPRKPAAFPVGAPLPGVAETKSRRAPAALPPVAVIEETADIFNELEPLAESPAALPAKSGWSAGRIFLAAAGLIVSFALALWTDALIARLFSRADWLGWTGIAALGVALAALIFMLIREWAALRRLDSVSLTRERAAKAYEGNDEIQARQIIDTLSLHLKAQPETASGRRILDETKGEVVDGRDLIRLAETELLAPLDRKAASLVMNAAKRVSVVTAVSPRALVDVGYILFESFRLIRSLSELYGSRPATLGLLRLAKNVVAHLAVTGTVAMGDSLIQQMLGHGIAAKLSARLGEGVINGLMTARVGIAAMDLTRPLPFKAEKRPGITDFLGELTRIGSKPAKD
jgi:putative membrane protein